MTILGIIVDVILFLVIAGNAVAGYKMGLTRVVFNIFSSLIAIILVFILYKPISNYIYHNTKIGQNIEITIQEKLSGFLIEKTKEQNGAAMQKENTKNDTIDIFLGEEVGQMIETASGDLVASVSNEISYKIISGVVFLVLFAVIRLALYVLKNYADFLANLPFIRLINSSGGMIYGVIKGFLLVYVILAIISLMMPMISDTIVIQAINEAFIGSKMFKSNIILNVIFKFL